MKRIAKPGLPAGWQAGLGQWLERKNITESLISSIWFRFEDGCVNIFQEWVFNVRIM
jgi:hypothetical protein